MKTGIWHVLTSSKFHRMKWNRMESSPPHIILIRAKIPVGNIWIDTLWRFHSTERNWLALKFRLKDQRSKYYIWIDISSKCHHFKRNRINLTYPVSISCWGPLFEMSGWRTISLPTTIIVFQLSISTSYQCTEFRIKLVIIL